MVLLKPRQGRREGTRCRSDLIPPTKLNTTKGGMDSVLKSSSGGHSKMSPNLNARGLGLGETPLGRWGGYRGSVIVSVDHCERRRNAELSIAVHRLVLHRSAPPTGVAKRRDRQRTSAGRALNCGIVEATTGKTRRYQVPKRPNTPCALRYSGGWWKGLGQYFRQPI